MVKRVWVALALGTFLIVPAAYAQQYRQTTPAYCVGFSAASCEQITAVIEAKTRPAYCVPGYGRTENPQHLTAEQLRICQAMPFPVDPEDQRRFDDMQAKQQRKRQQEIGDARAMVSETWVQYGHSIEAIEIGFKCDVIDQLSAKVAIGQIQVAMDGSKNRAGLIGDPTLDMEKTTNDFIQAGKEAVANGACDRMTPQSRARLRQMVGDLMN